MKYYLSRRAVLKWLEAPSIYHISRDELYELDSESFRFMINCSTGDGCSSRDGAFTDYCMEEGLLTKEKTVLERPSVSQAPSPSLRYLEVQLTDACNLRCKHCYIGEPAGNELSPAQLEKVFGEFEDMQGLRVLLSGGEPLLHSRFRDINGMLPDYFFRKVLFSNGILMTKELISSLRVDEVQISIDGLERAHEHVRGPGTFNRAMEAVRCLLDAGIDVSISTMVHHSNLEDFDAMEQMFKDMGVKDWTVDVPCPSGRLERHGDLSVDPGKGGKYLGYGYGGGLHSSSRGYGCGLHLMAVLADGNIAKCTFYHASPAGSIEEGLRTAWSRIRPVRLADLACRCEYLDVCRGGCRYRAELLTGNNGKDPYRCVLYGIL